MFIRTERLFLRPGWPEDMDELAEVLSEEAASRGPSDRTVLARRFAELKAYLSRPRERLLPHFLINLREDDGARLIGGVTLARRGEDVELGYWLARRHRGQGYAAEAVRAVLAEARMLGHTQVVAAPDIVLDGHGPRVLEQAGFKLAPETRRRGSMAGAARPYVAVLADKLFDVLGVGPQLART